MEEITNLLHDASNRLHLTRERAIERFDRTLSNSVDGERKIFAALKDKESISGLQNQLCDSVRSTNWEGRLGTLRVAAIWITKGNPDDWFLDRITRACDELLEDEEVRVRMAVGEVLRALSARRGICTWQAMGGRITSSIMANMVGFSAYICFIRPSLVFLYYYLHAIMFLHAMTVCRREMDREV
jgi:hypothetical protein